MKKENGEKSKAAAAGVIGPEDVWRTINELAEAQKRTEVARLKGEEARKRLAVEVAEAQKRTEAAQQEGEAARKRLAVEVAEAQKRTEEAQQRTEEAQQKSEEARKRLAAEVAEAQKRTEAAQQKGEEARKRLAIEVAEAQKRTEAAQTRNEAEIDKLIKSIDEANGNFNNKWGQFLESLAAGDFLDLIKQVGIAGVHTLYRNLVREDEQGRQLAEIDLVGANTSDAVAGEVKTNLTIAKIDKTLAKVKKHGCDMFKKYNRVYVAFIFLKAEEGAVEYAESQGCIVIKAPGGQSKVSALVNQKGFKPKAFIG